MPVVLARSWGGPVHREKQKFVVGTESQRGQEHQGFTKHRGVHTEGNRCARLGRRAALAPLNVPRKDQKACQRKPRNVTFHNRQELKQPKCSLPGDRKPKGATSEHQTLLGEDGRGRGHRPPRQHETSVVTRSPEEARWGRLEGTRVIWDNRSRLGSWLPSWAAHLSNFISLDA